MLKTFTLGFILAITTGLVGSVLAQDRYSGLRESPEDSLTTKNFPGSWNLPGTDLYLKIGGYFRMDAIYDFNGAGSRNQLLMSQIPVEGTPEATAGPFFNFHVRETRFNFDVRRTTSDLKSLKFFLEFDFFDEGLKAGQPRMRHAFIKYGNWTFGQTWTNLSDLRVFPFIMDFSAGDALFGGRSVQVRYENNFTKNWQLGVSLEMPSLVGIANPSDLAGEKMPVLPIFSARFTNERPNGMISVGAQIENLRWDGRDQVPNTHATGWGAIFNGRQYISKKLFGTWHASYSSGMTNQILIFAGTDQGAVILPSGELYVEDAITLAIGAGYQLTNSFQTNISYAYVDRGKLEYREANTLEEGGMGHYNVIWHIYKNAMVGVEYAWGTVYNIDRATGNAHRLQAMVKYQF